MARCMISGMLKAGFPATNIWATSRSDSTHNKLQTLGSINAIKDNLLAVQQTNIIILSVKPKDLPAVLEEIRPAVTAQHLLISIAAGVTVDTLSRYLSPKPTIIRAMPNTPVEVNQGVYGIYAKETLAASVKNTIIEILQLTGKLVWLDSENDLDSLTSISGCGPAYVFMLIASLEQAANNLGLPPEQTKMLAAQTILGAGMQALQSSISATDLCKRVCSPGGMTEKGVEYLKIHNFTPIIEQAVLTTYKHLNPE